ncbi:MAG: efflux RND transporter periplasmic adaptor subunit, partial [Candidatus Omnitrophica bacterium]|nr:efflux RND transporter periplasmic adaptor subunit [Candidatus Omnitrophota bacterium]
MNKRLGILLISVAIAMGGFWSAQRFGGGIARRVKESSLVKGVKGMAPEAEKIAPQAVEESRRLLVRVFKTAKGDFKDFLPAIGVIQASLEVELKFATEGTIESLNFQEGDVVRKGDLLGALDQKDARLKLEFNQAKLKTAKTQELGAKKKLDMNKELYEIGVIIKAKLEEVAIEYETAKSQAESAQKEVAFAQSEFDKTYLYSPVNGVMGRRESEMGEVVNSNTKIAVVYDIARVSSEVGITEKDIDKVRLGQTMEVTVDTYSGQKFTG